MVVESQKPSITYKWRLCSYMVHGMKAIADTFSVSSDMYLLIYNSLVNTIFLNFRNCRKDFQGRTFEFDKKKYLLSWLSSFVRGCPCLSLIKEINMTNFRATATFFKGIANFLSCSSRFWYLLW